MINIVMENACKLHLDISYETTDKQLIYFNSKVKVVEALARINYTTVNLLIDFLLLKGLLAS